MICRKLVMAIGLAEENRRKCCQPKCSIFLFLFLLTLAPIDFPASHLIAARNAMGSLLEEYIDRTVSIITSDARSIVGTLRGFDQFANVIVEDSHERVYSAQGMEKVPLGLYVIRGDNIAVIGELNEQLDKQIDFSSLRAQPLQHVLH